MNNFVYIVYYLQKNEDFAVAGVFTNRHDAGAVVKSFKDKNIEAYASNTPLNVQTVDPNELHD
jgi:hypothetical protein